MLTELAISTMHVSEARYSRKRLGYPVIETDLLICEGTPEVLDAISDTVTPTVDIPPQPSVAIVFGCRSCRRRSLAWLLRCLEPQGRPQCHGYFLSNSNIECRFLGRSPTSHEQLGRGYYLCRHHGG